MLRMMPGKRVLAKQANKNPHYMQRLWGRELQSESWEKGQQTQTKYTVWKSTGCSRKGIGQNSYVIYIKIL